MAVELAPYLNFNGNCREAMEFYKGVFGGELSLTTLGEGMPSGDAERDQHIMHATLTNDHISFMASDGMGNTTVGDNVQLSLAGEDVDEEVLRGYFEGLSQGGRVDQPLEKAPWGAIFGMLTDRFGIHWMVNIGG